MERILESRSVSPASPWICIREVEKKRPRRSEVIYTENSVPYLVGNHLCICPCRSSCSSWCGYLSWLGQLSAVHSTSPITPNEKKCQKWVAEAYVCNPYGVLGTEASWAGCAKTSKAWLWAVCPTRLDYVLPQVWRVLPSRACIPSWICPDVTGSRLSPAGLDAGGENKSEARWQHEPGGKIPFTSIVWLRQSASEFLCRAGIPQLRGKGEAGGGHTNVQAQVTLRQTGREGAGDTHRARGVVIKSCESMRRELTFHSRCYLNFSKHFLRSPLAGTLRAPTEVPRTNRRPPGLEGEAKTPTKQQPDKHKSRNPPPQAPVSRVSSLLRKHLI